ncbi:MAG: ABC transporter ATP-binding protein [Chloroflexota bacterium]
MAGYAVEATGLSRVFGGASPVHAVRKVDLFLRSGEFLAVIGPSGSGKTTLLNLIGGLENPTSGRVVVDGHELGTFGGDALADFRRRTIGFVFQLFYLVPVLTALENVMLPLLPYRRGLGFDLRQRAEELIRYVGLVGRMHHLPGQLSGGEQQRVAVARAVVNRPKVVLADEPAGNLDSETGMHIISLLRRLIEEHGISVLLATHDSAVAARADRVVHLHDGQIVEDAH